jgi:hypothetical protein
LVATQSGLSGKKIVIFFSYLLAFSHIISANLVGSLRALRVPLACRWRQQGAPWWEVVVRAVIPWKIGVQEGWTPPRGRSRLPMASTPASCANVRLSECRIDAAALVIDRFAVLM